LLAKNWLNLSHIPWLSSALNKERWWLLCSKSFVMPPDVTSAATLTFFQNRIKTSLFPIISFLSVFSLVLYTVYSIGLAALYLSHSSHYTIIRWQLTLAENYTTHSIKKHKLTRSCSRSSSNNAARRLRRFCKSSNFASFSCKALYASILNTQTITAS